ncbi:MAG TPA: hypothetical protein VGG30_05810, partial [Pirellulales bacterium]
PRHLRLGQVHLTETDFARLADHLSPGAYGRLEAAENLPEKRELIFEWAQTAIRHRFETGGVRAMLPAVSTSELQRFAGEELSSEQRVPLAKMQREKKFRELRWLYFLSKGRLKEIKPDDISTGGPAHGGGPLHRSSPSSTERQP